MEDYRKIMARVGWMLVAIGLIDIGVMVYCIVNRISYSSSFNIFAVIAGIFLIRGSLASARVVAWFLAFSIVGIGLMLLIMSLIEPFSLRATQVKLAPLSFVTTVIFSIIFFGLLTWSYLQLRSPAILEVRKKAGLTTTRPLFAFALGGLLAAGLGVAMFMVNNGESGKLVKEKAREALGENYEYHVSAMSWYGDGLSAQLVAFNSSEIMPVTVQCTEHQLTKCSISFASLTGTQGKLHSPLPNR